MEQLPPTSSAVLLPASASLRVAVAQVSSYQKDIGRCLTSLGFSPVSEDTSLGVSLDIYLPDQGLAIEVDGPTHFCRNTKQPLGHTAFKRRLLRALGVKLLPVSYEEWDSLLSKEDRRRFLQVALKGHR